MSYPWLRDMADSILQEQFLSARVWKRLDEETGLWLAAEDIDIHEDDPRIEAGTEAIL